MFLFLGPFLSFSFVGNISRFRTLCFDSLIRFDFFIVVVGFLEMTPAKAIFEYFPVVVFRLLRLLRVFRLAKALPRLRSIVQALISGFAVVSFFCDKVLVVA